MRKTFSIGGIAPNDKKISAESAIELFPIGEKAYISMSQHLGAPSDPIVAKGDRVKTGQLIGKSSGFISAQVHSPVSGVVSSVGALPDMVGNKVTHIVIDVEGDEWEESIDRSPEVVREITLGEKEIVERIAEAGIVGLGGAAFPTHIKLTPPPGKSAQFLLINGAECEPYITSDYRVMLERTEELLVGVEIMMKALGVSKAYFGIEENKPKAIEAITTLAENSFPSIEVVTLKKRYPQGGEKQLIDALLKRRVPSMALPIDVGVVVQNVATAIAVYEAVQKNKPLFEGVVTVTGDHLKEQKNYQVRVGTPYQALIDAVGGTPEGEVKVISGGPMMGKAISRVEAATVKSSSSVLILTREQTKRRVESNCIRCAKCIEVCPMGLEPYLLNKLARANKLEELESNVVYDCIECGSCSYICPATIPLLDTIRLAKGKVLRVMRSRPKK